MKLVQPHRLALIGLAVATAVFLWLQVNESGLSESPWLASLIVISLALCGASFPFGSSIPLRADRHSVSGKQDEGKEIVEARAMILAKHFRIHFRNAIPITGPKAFRAINEAQADYAAMMAAYRAYQLVLSRRSSQFRSSDDFRHLKAWTAVELATIMHRQDGDEFGELQLAKSAMFYKAELNKYDAQLRDLMARMRQREKFPLDAIFKDIETLLPCGRETATARESFYGPRFKEAIGLCLVPVGELKNHDPTVI